MAHKSDINKAGWEQGDFPILCETCASKWLTYVWFVKAVADIPLSVQVLGTILSYEW